MLTRRAFTPLSLHTAILFTSHSKCKPYILRLPYGFILCSYACVNVIEFRIYIYFLFSIYIKEAKKKLYYSFIESRRLIRFPINHVSYTTSLINLSLVFVERKKPMRAPRLPFLAIRESFLSLSRKCRPIDYCLLFAISFDWLIIQTEIVLYFYTKRQTKCVDVCLFIYLLFISIWIRTLTHLFVF